MNRSLRVYLVKRTVKSGWLFLAAIMCAGCPPQLPIAPPDDAGHMSYARQVVPILYGRKIKGYAETKLLSDLAAATNRDIVSRALMQQPEYVDHWSEMLVDDLRMHREGPRAQTTCFAAPLDSDPDAALAQWILTHDPAFSPPPPTSPFNMSDVLRSSLKRDNLFPIYNAHLFAMENRPGSGTPQEMRHTLGRTFEQVYMHREMLCLTCHNSEYSLSGNPPSGWNRTHPIPGYFERALYGAAEGEPTADAFAMFRTDVLGGGTAPWGMQGCGTFKTTVPNDPENVTSHFVQTNGKQFTIRGVQQLLATGYADLDADGLQRTLEPGIQAQCDFCAANCTGDTLSCEDVANNAVNAATVKTLLTNTAWSSGDKCIDCHGGSASLYFTTGSDWACDLIGVPSSQQPAKYRVNPGDAGGSYLIQKLKGSAGINGSQMPLGANALSAGQITQVEAWINSMPSLGACGACETLPCNEPRRYVDGREAFAFLTAATAVNKTWAGVFGVALTIANYFPRNGSQRNALWNLTEYRFIPNDWSLRDVLARILTSTLFNRRAPRDSTLSNAYVVPTVYDPWIVADPRVPPVSEPGYDPLDHRENHFNAVGESVHRYSARSLLYSIHKALDWPAPMRFPTGSAYPDAPLMKAIGQYFTDSEPGFAGVDLQGLLAWESIHGACMKPTGVAEDWIDRLMDAIAAFDPASPGGPLTVQDVIVVMRDWLLGHGGVETISPVDLTGTEAKALESHFGMTLDKPVSSVTNLEDKLRGFCGVLVETPQFMLAGLAPIGLGPKPRLRICNETPCTYQEMCGALHPAIEAQLTKTRLVCGTNSVFLLPELDISDFVDIWQTICPPGLCGLIVDRIPEGCFRDLDVNACRIEPPECDPRCERIDCCGGPLPPIDRRGRALGLVWAEGARVRQARGVKILRQGADQFELLRRGQRLGFGDLLVIPPDGDLSIRTAAGRIQTPPRQKRDDRQKNPVFLLVTGERALKPLQEEVTALRKPPMDRIKRVRGSEWARRGEAGLPLTAEEFRSFKYSDEEIGMDQLIKRGLLPPGKQEQPPAPKP